MLLAAANAYLGLFAGLTVATAIPAAVVSMGVLRLMGRSSILENDIITHRRLRRLVNRSGHDLHGPCARDHGSLDAFRILVGARDRRPRRPARRTVLRAASPALILDQGLQFPEGVATAEVLKVGQDPGRGLKALSMAAGSGAIFKLMLSGLRLSPESFAIARYFGDRTIGFFGINLSPALLGVGFIVGFNIGCLMLFGSALSLVDFIPFYNNFMIDQNPDLAAQLVGLSAADAAGLIWSKADPLHRRRRDADRRPLVAVVAPQVPALRHQDRHVDEGLGRWRTFRIPSVTCR